MRNIKHMEPSWCREEEATLMCTIYYVRNPNRDPMRCFHVTLCSNSSIWSKFSIRKALYLSVSTFLWESFTLWTWTWCIPWAWAWTSKSMVGITFTQSVNKARFGIEHGVYHEHEHDHLINGTNNKVYGGNNINV